MIGSFLLACALGYLFGPWGFLFGLLLCAVFFFWEVALDANAAGEEEYERNKPKPLSRLQRAELDEWRRSWTGPIRDKYEAKYQSRRRQVLERKRAPGEGRS